MGKAQMYRYYPAAGMEAADAVGGGEAVFTVKRKPLIWVCLACGGGIPDH